MKNEGTNILLYFILLILIFFAEMQLIGVIVPVTGTTHIGGHQCAVMRTGFERSISCDWTKP